MAKKTKNQKVKKPEPPGSFVKNVLPGILGGAVVFGAYLGLDSYYQKQLDSRHSAYSEHMKKTSYKPVPQPDYWSAWEKLRHVRKLNDMESATDENLGEFLKFVETNKSKIADMTESLNERFGYIEKSGSSFVISEEKRRIDEGVKYTREALAGNFDNTEALIDLIRSNWGDFGFANSSETNYTIVAIEILRAKPMYDRLSSEDKKSFGFKAFSDDGAVVEQKIENFEKLYEASRQLLEGSIKPITGFMRGSARIKLDEIRDKTNAISRWHTHPVNDPNYDPSGPDIANTYVAGPNFLFSQKDGTLYVFSINRGQSKEVYKTSLR